MKLTTRDGRTITGVRMNEDTWSIQVRDSNLGSALVLEAGFDGASVEQRTLMPSYAKQLSEKELTDIVAFLASTGGQQ